MPLGTCAVVDLAVRAWQVRCGGHASHWPQTCSEPVVLQEMESEGSAKEICQDNLDRCLVARLIEEPPADYPLQPVPYLLGCYQRALDLPSNNPLGSSCTISLKEVLMNHVWLCLGDEGIVEQAPELEARGAMQLFDALWTAVPHNSGEWKPTPGIFPLPPTFFSHALRAFPAEMASLLDQMLAELGRRASHVSILGDFNALNSCWFCLMEDKDLVAAVVKSLCFLPAQPIRNGRDFQLRAPLAALVAITFMPDPLPPLPLPSLLQQVWMPMDPNTVSQADMAVVVVPSGQHISALCQLFSPKALLAKDVRAATLAWIGTALASDTERSKTIMNLHNALSNGFVHNLTRVLLHLAAPFLDFYSGKACQFIDPRYASLKTAAVAPLL
jgi:hypothetical protein